MEACTGCLSSQLRQLGNYFNTTIKRKGFTMYGSSGVPAGAALIGSGTLASTRFDTLGYMITGIILVAAGALLVRQRHIANRSPESEGREETR